MIEHTKGPWRKESYRLFANQTARHEYPIHAPKRGLIAKAFKEDDARLIAAAPDLLEALQKFAEYEKAMDEREDVLGMLIYAEFSKLAHAAIAKAEGTA